MTKHKFLFLTSLAAVILLVPWVYTGLRELGENMGWPFLVKVGYGTVAERMLLILVLPCALWTLWQSGWRKWSDYGYGQGWLTAAPWGFALGLIAVIAAIAFQIALGARSMKPDPAWLAVFGVLLSAIVVSLIEELVFRGILLRLLQKRLLFPLANLAHALIYAWAHFLSPPGFGSRHEATWSSGFEWLAACFTQFFQPQLLDKPGLWIKFATLTALGWLMGESVRRSGHIGWAVGFHAGAVLALLTARQWTEAEKGWWRPWIGKEPVESLDILLLALLLCTAQALILSIKSSSHRCLK